VIVALVGAALILSGTAWADHVIYFKSGTSLPVRAYRVEAGLVHVDLGGNGFMAFPEALIEKIENPHRSLNLKPSTVQPDSYAPMRATSGRRGGGGGVGGGGAPAGYQPPTSKNPGVLRPDVDVASKAGQPGIAGAYRAAQYNTGGFDPAAAAGNNSAGNGSLRGAQRVGDKYVLPGRGRTPERRVNINLRDGTRVLPPGFKPPNTGADPPKVTNDPPKPSGDPPAESGN
jgi:hypothetical protein